MLVILLSESSYILCYPNTCIFHVQLELMVKFAAYVPELVASSIETVYFYNPNMAFKQCAHRLSSTIRIFSHIKVIITQQFKAMPPPSLPPLTHNGIMQQFSYCPLPPPSPLSHIKIYYHKQRLASPDDIIFLVLFSYCPPQHVS